MAGSNDFTSSVAQVFQRFHDILQSSLVTGAAHILPFLVTALVVGMALDFIIQLLQPVGAIIQTFWSNTHSPPFIGGILVSATFSIIFVVGILIETTNREQTIERLHSLIGAIPGIGSIYLIFRRMSESLFQNDMKSFRDVKLVEYPNEGTYTFGFVTDHSPPKIPDVVPYEDVQTLFMPLAPNPVLGGRVIYVPKEYLYEIDMTVEEAIRTLITSGVVTETHSPSAERSLEQQQTADQSPRNQQNTEQ